MSPELKQMTEILFVRQAEGTAAWLRTLTSLTQKSGYSVLPKYSVPRLGQDLELFGFFRRELSRAEIFLQIFCFVSTDFQMLLYTVLCF